MMTDDEAEDLLDLLAARYPGDWHDRRCVEWVKEMVPLGYPLARAAIEDMSRVRHFPTIAGLHEAAERRAPRLRAPMQTELEWRPTDEERGEVLSMIAHVKRERRGRTA